MPEPRTQPDYERATRSARWRLLVVMGVGYFLVLLDVTVVNVALPQMDRSLGAGITGLQWVVDGYAVALASLLLAGGVLGDVHGHKRVVLAGLAVFGAASLGCGFAPGTEVLIAARIGQGIGAALLLPGTLAVIVDVFPDRAERARAIGIWAAVGGAALPAGPLLGGALVQNLGWRAVFLLNVPIVLLAAGPAARLIRPGGGSGTRRLDRAGVGLGGLLLVAITVAVIETGRAGLTPMAVTAIIAAAGLLFAFLRVEHAAPDPMLPLSLFRRRAFCAANAIAGVMNLGTLGLLFVLTQYLQIVQHRSALAAGIVLLPLFLPLVVLAPLAGRVVGRYGPARPMAAGLVVAACGVALLARLQPGSPYAALLPAVLLWGLGLGALTPAVVAAAVSAVETGRSGLASAVNNTARQAGGAIGIAAYGASSGSATDGARFVGGLHVAGLLTAGLFLGAGISAVTLIPAHRMRVSHPASGTRLAQNRAGSV